jgi:hypothetical protein
VANQLRCRSEDFAAPPRVTILLRTMGLGLGPKLKISQSTDKSIALKIIYERLAGPSQKVVEQLSVVGITHVPLRESKQGINCLVSARLKIRTRPLKTPLAHC